LFVVLNNAQAIYPQILEVQSPCDDDGVLKRLREFSERNTLEMSFDIRFRGGQNLQLSPTMTERGIFPLNASGDEKTSPSRAIWGSDVNDSSGQRWWCREQRLI
jgi:hypothetical protein